MPPLAWPTEGAEGSLGSGAGWDTHKERSGHRISCSQLQAPLRRFLRQEIVTEVVSSVPRLPSCPRLSASFARVPTAAARGPAAPPPQQEPWLRSQLSLPLARGAVPSLSLGLAVPWGTEGRRAGLSLVLGPAEGRRGQEGPVPLPVHGPHRLHHPEAEVGLPEAQLHEPVSGPGAAGGPGQREQLSFPGSTAPPWPEHLRGSPRYTAASVIDTASKYKLLWKLPLEDADIIKGGAGLGSPGALGVRGSSSEKPAWRVCTVAQLAGWLSACFSASGPHFLTLYQGAGTWDPVCARGPGQGPSARLALA